MFGRITAYGLLAFTLTACSSVMPPAFLARSVRASDFPGGAPRVQLDWPVATIDTTLPQSTYCVSLRSKRNEAGELEIRGKYVAAQQQQSNEQHFNLKTLGFQESDARTLNVVWVDGNGSRTPIPHENASQ